MSDEVSLIPPYLLDTDGAQPEEGGAQRTYGTLSYNRRRDCWVVKGDPGVTELCKRLFPGSATARRGEARFTAHRRVVGDLNWLMLRYPLLVKPADQQRWEKALEEARDYAVHRELARRMPEARFLWFGWTDPHLIPQEIRQAMEQAPENVTFAGFVDRETLREAYCGADVFAFMSHEETEGIVVLEALACGIPTVVRDIPVYNGWLREGQNVYKASGTDEFQQKAEGLLTGTLPDLTAAGRRVAEERSLSVMGERLREVYRRMDILPAAQPAAKTNLPQAERPVQHSFTP